MGQPRGRLHLAVEALGSPGMIEQLRVDDLERHGPIHPTMLRLVDAAHAADPQALLNVIAAVLPQLRR